MAVLERDPTKDEGLAGYRWMTIVLFGESSGGQFERGVGQYPTVGDEVHFVTSGDLSVIYGREPSAGGLTIGNIASTSGIPATLDLGRFVSRHCAIVGSTGAGKSNLVSVILEALGSTTFPSARVLVIDPHGEYGRVATSRSIVFRVTPGASDQSLVVPYWALPFDEMLSITFGGMSPANEAIVRDLVQDMKRDAASQLKNPPPSEAITADTPIPFSIRQLWFDLDDFERRTFKNANGQRVPTEPEKKGDPQQLIPNIYPIHGPGGKEPFKNPSPRGLGKQLELARSRLTDARYAFLFNPSGGFAPDIFGKVEADIDGLVASWVGHDKPLTILDVSELPSDVAGDVVGLLLRIVYDTVFWAGSLAISGRSQPLLIVIDEAHRFLPEGSDSSCHRILTRIAKEGRKYGVGLVVVTQRPSEVDATVLSQCGTMIALRTTNPGDRTRVAAAFPDDLGGLVDLLPSLRTGEGLFVGEAMFVPSRVRVRLTQAPESSSDPSVTKNWMADARPDPKLYSQALGNWRRQVKG
ncbi:DNA helicase HerA-like ATPase [Bradyrhizobium sp. USDA 4538]|uniref:ATP-binding protein n=1 Tax=unclassified Bradyrhizobium TaxID=2631580 RepID=UPI0020A21176|nr:MULTISPECIES: ATP-binding protein [unclassified Bradyrhizobium]MCP1842141.1 DNA helicase HerA-like ATPase [Bradyrhizobium sp. USDA 4538]MCP1902705.1 DNA helicase HerA-like ATPase [Bradyrhizobium sp. USDA 4537]MCP1991638.1 DNA helicase HerA-like ATPase [Bradyrhizobium sp. USDA 4539]